MITGPVTISYPVLFDAKPNLSGDLKFSCCLLVDKADKASIGQIRAEIKRALAKGKEKLWSGKTPKFRYQPLRDGDEELADGTKDSDEYKNRFFINTSANEDSPPGVVGPDAQPLMDQGSIYSGCVVRADIRAFPYKRGGNNGVGWWLNNIMLVSDGPRLDGKMNAVDAFADFAVQDDPVTDDGELA